MEQIIDVFMLAGEEVTTQLSFSTQMILLAIYIVAAVLLILKTIEIYKDLIVTIKGDREMDKKLERIIQQAEHQAQGIHTNPTENINQHKIKFK